MLVHTDRQAWADARCFCSKYGRDEYVYGAYKRIDRVKTAFLVGKTILQGEPRSNRVQDVSNDGELKKSGSRVPTWPIGKLGNETEGWMHA